MYLQMCTAHVLWCKLELCRNMCRFLIYIKQIEKSFFSFETDLLSPHLWKSCDQFWYWDSMGKHTDFFFDLATVGTGPSVMPKNYNNNTRPLLTHCERNQKDIVAFSATQSNGEREIIYREFKMFDEHKNIVITIQHLYKDCDILPLNFLCNQIRF